MPEYAAGNKKLVLRAGLETNGEENGSWEEEAVLSSGKSSL